MDSLLGAALKLARMTYSHFEKHPYPARLTEEMFHGVADDTTLWKPINDSNEFAFMFHLAVERSKFRRDEILSILQEYVYDIGVNLPRWTNPDVDQELHIRAKLVTSDLVAQLPPYIALSPVFQLHGSIESVPFDDCILRQAAYSERIWYRPSYPLLVHSYGPEGFEYLIEVDRNKSLRHIEDGLGNRYMRTCASVVTAIRLVCGGTAGLQFLTARNHFERLDFGKKREPGTLCPLHYISHGVEHIWQPGKSFSILDSSTIKPLIILAHALKSVSSSGQGFIWRAIRRFCGSVSGTQGLDDSILDLIIAFESLFGENKERAACRAATLLSLDDGYSSSLANHLEALWNARNALAHGESIDEAQTRVKGNLPGKATLAFHALRTCLLATVSLKPDNAESFRKNLDEASKETISKARVYRDIPHQILDVIRKEISSMEELIVGVVK